MSKFLYFVLSLLMLLALVNISVCQEDDDEKNSKCDAYVDIVPHLQPISGNCDKLRPLNKVDLDKLNGRTWVVLNDSHAQASEEVCEFFSIRFENNVLYTTEVVQKSNVTVVLHEKMTADKEQNGVFYENEDEKAVVLALDDDYKTICFAECGPLDEKDNQDDEDDEDDENDDDDDDDERKKREEGDEDDGDNKYEDNKDGQKRYGAHVFCAARNADLNDDQLQLIERAEREVNQMGLNINFKNMKPDCYRSPTNRYDG